MCVSSEHLWNRAFRWGMAGFDVVCCHGRASQWALVESSVQTGTGFDVVCCHWCASPVGTRGIQRLDGDWLVLMWCTATCVVFRTGACGIECLHR